MLSLGLVHTQQAQYAVSTTQVPSIQSRYLVHCQAACLNHLVQQVAAGSRTKYTCKSIELYALELLEQNKNVGATTITAVACLSAQDLGTHAAAGWLSAAATFFL